ncbi:hypothetical protein BZL29_1556 [Mycobacterium kansasii]|uniref:DUF3159 domain-containing protein n=1 Tax=Mycobacterium kansasii TaxID=1768 RepID=A0A1V3XXE9_MYCKA|nr:hypothetical protein BZL29_1556 [Mycobacterium kansasii]
MSTHRISAERLLAQAGGVSGLVYSSLPVVVFVAVSGVAGLLPAIGSAVGVAALVLLLRLIRRESTQPAISGFFGVAVCALIAYLVGQSKGYFLLGIWMSLLWAVIFALSVVIRRPAVGVLWSWAAGRDRGWRDVPAPATRLTSPRWVGRWCSPPGSSSSGFSTMPTRPAGWASRASEWAGRSPRWPRWRHMPR